MAKTKVIKELISKQDSEADTEPYKIDAIAKIDKATVRSFPMVIVNNDVSSFIRSCAKTTFSEIARSRYYGQNKSIVRLKKEHDEKYVRMQLCGLILNIQTYLNLHEERRMSDAVIIDVANTIIDNYPNMYLSDIAMTFNLVKSGKYGGKILTLSGPYRS